MDLSFIPIWKEAPFIRILLPFIAGIVYEYYQETGVLILLTILLFSFAGLIGFFFVPLPVQFKKGWVHGVFINILLVSAGALITAFNDTSVYARQIETFGTDKTIFTVTMQEPLSEKRATWKTSAAVKSLQRGTHQIFPSTNILMYFRKDSLLVQPEYGNRIAFIKSPERIKNTPAMGSFDYEKYCALKNIYFQVFLKPHEFIILPGENTNALDVLLFSTREWVTEILKKYIPGKKECGLAEALLIGYKDDLDRSLIQAYINTGVVHVVAISGLHLGLIYALLKYCCIPFGRKRLGRLMTPLIIITGLWLFSFLAGGSPSVLRSAVMFTAIVLGECMARRSPLVNNLAASAFFLLCYDPYWLWDIGFQLSYAALLSIIIFMKPVYGLIVFKNKIADTVWKLNAVTLAAQLLTTPVSLYYFHQFPNLFLITNFIAVPLSSIILMGEIGLCLAGYMAWVAKPVGWLLWWLIKLMNGSVEYIDSFSFSRWQGINIGFMQLVLLYVIIGSAAGWLILQKKRWLPVGLVGVILFLILRSLKYGSPLHFK